MTTQWKVANFQDPDLVPANIKSGVNIFGVDGTYSGGWILWEQSGIMINTDNKTYIEEATGDNDSYTITQTNCVDEDVNYLYFICISKFFNWFQQLNYCHMVMWKIDKTNDNITTIYWVQWVAWNPSIVTTKSDATNIYIRFNWTWGWYYPQWWLLTIAKSDWTITRQNDTSNNPWTIIGNSVVYKWDTLSAWSSWQLFQSSWDDPVLWANWFILKS